MTTRKVILWFAIAIPMGIFLTLTVCSIIFDETLESHYQNKQEIIADKAIERGWLPNNIPESAHDIYERHELDTNHGYGRFHFDKDERETFTSSMKKINPRDYRKKIWRKAPKLKGQNITWYCYDPFIYAIENDEEVAHFFQ